MEFNLNESNTNKEKRKQYIMNDLNDKLNWLDEFATDVIKIKLLEKFIKNSMV